MPRPSVDEINNITDSPGKNVGYQRHDKQELAQLCGTPCSFEVLSAIENRCGSDEQSHNVLLD